MNELINPQPIPSKLGQALQRGEGRKGGGGGVQIRTPNMSTEHMDHRFRFSLLIKITSTPGAPESERLVLRGLDPCSFLPPPPRTMDNGRKQVARLRGCWCPDLVRGCP